MAASTTHGFALRVLLTDWEGTRLWVSLLDDYVTKLVGFDANTFTGLISDSERFNALTFARGVSMK